MKCVECCRKCYEYLNNRTSDKSYYKWTYKQDKCNQSDTEVKEKNDD